MSRWTSIRDTFRENPVETVGAALVNPAIVVGTAGGTAGAYYGNPTVQSYEMLSQGSGSDIPGVDEIRGVYEGITGQTAADAATEAAQAQREGMEYSADIQKEMFETSRQDQMPWLESGEWALGELESRMGNEPTFEDYQMSDYAKFLKQQGLESIEAKSRAGGYYNTGGTSKAMMQYAQDIAGQDYQQYLNNYYQSLNPFMQVAGLGQQQSQSLAAQSGQTASALGQSAVGAANAYAQGITGAANARTAGLQNLLSLGAYIYGAS